MTARKQYTTGQKIIATAIIMAIIANLGIWGTVIYREITKPAPVMGVDYYPMANQHIEWYYAGKDITDD